MYTFILHIKIPFEFFKAFVIQNFRTFVHIRFLGRICKTIELINYSNATTVFLIKICCAC